MALDIKLANKTTEFTNSSVSKIIASKAVGNGILTRNHVNEAAAKAAGLSKGDIYHTAGALKVVVA
jgi:hypothetical protein|tara:strand:- start:8200 stop:8397 length:198 start_codon:yes stop_codon:yes gene_type:complete